MISLKDYINESVFDDEEAILSKVDKSIVDDIKVWARDNISKQRGKVKVNSKTGEITLLGGTYYPYFTIQCPIPVGATFSEFKPGSLILENPTKEEISLVCSKIDKKHDYTLQIYSERGIDIPSELDGMLGELRMEFKGDLNFFNYKFDLTSLKLRGDNSTVKGTKSINIKGNIVSIIDTELKDDLGNIEVDTIFLKNVIAKNTLLKGLKRAETIHIDNSSDIDLRNCVCDTLELHNIDVTYDLSFLPKKVNSLIIKSDKFEDFDFSNIKSNVKQIYLNGLKIDKL